MLVAGPASGRLELIELRIALIGEFAIGRFAVEVCAGAVIKSSVQVFPDLYIRITEMCRCRRGFRYTQPHQYPLE